MTEAECSPYQNRESKADTRSSKILANAVVRAWTSAHCLDTMKTRYVAYLRVSTKMQGLDGLGIAAQTDAVRSFVEIHGGEIVGQFAETESGAKDDRPQLLAALTMCRKAKAVLLVARLDRLSRDAAFLLSLRKSDVEFRCVDMPECDRFTVSLFAVLAERERDLIASRTRLALQAAKRRGVRLGTKTPERQVRLMNIGARRAREQFANKVRPIVEEIKETGIKTWAGVAEALNRRGISTRQGTRWYGSTVKALG